MMTHENDDSFPDDDSYDATQAAEQEIADKSYDEALRALSDKSTDPGHPNFAAGLATERHAMIDKFGSDPEDPAA